MDELMQQLQQRAGLSQDQAQKATAIFADCADLIAQIESIIVSTKTAAWKPRKAKNKKSASVKCSSA